MSHRHNLRARLERLVKQRRNPGSCPFMPTRQMTGAEYLAPGRPEMRPCPLCGKPHGVTEIVVASWAEVEAFNRASRQTPARQPAAADRPA